MGVEVGEGAGVELPDRYNTVYRLKFTDPELAPYEVRIRRSYGLVDAGGAAVGMDLDALKAGMAAPQDLAVLRGLVDAFADALVGWNVLVDGQPVPTTRDGVRSLDVLFVLALVGAFFDALTDMAAEAQRALEDAGGEPSLPMDVLAG